MSDSKLLKAKQTTSELPWQPVEDWSSLKDQTVEIHVGGKVADRGCVDDVMADGSALWLKNNGASGRRIIEHLPETNISLRRND